MLARHGQPGVGRQEQEDRSLSHHRVECLTCTLLPPAGVGRQEPEEERELRPVVAEVTPPKLTVLQPEI